MRKIAMLTTALMGLAFASHSFAQGSQSAPVSGLPPGASVGAGNAQPPPATGNVVTTRVGPATVAPRAPVAVAPAAVRAPTHRTVRRRFFHRRAHVATPAAAAQ